MLNHGASVDFADNDGCATLYLAAQEGHVEIVRWLLNHGVSCHVTRTENWTALLAAADNGNAEVFSELLKYRAFVTTAIKHHRNF